MVMNSTASSLFWNVSSEKDESVKATIIEFRAEYMNIKFADLIYEFKPTIYPPILEVSRKALYAM